MFIAWSSPSLNDDLDEVVGEEFIEGECARVLLSSPYVYTTETYYIRFVNAITTGRMRSKLPHEQAPFSFSGGRRKAWYEKVWNSQSDTAITLLERRERRRLVLTANGQYVLVPEHSKVGNIICVLLGCSVPVVLRPESTSGWASAILPSVGLGPSEQRCTFIRDCYVEFIMQGLLIEELERKERPLQIFALQ